MNDQINMHITQIYANKYRNASKKEKGAILNEYSLSTGVSGNLASKRFCKTVKNIYPLALKVRKNRIKSKGKRGPKIKYKTVHKELIKKVWELYECICAERLHSELLEGINELKKGGKLTNFNNNTIYLCKNTSLGQLKRIIGEFPKPEGYGKHNRKPGSYSQVPIEANFNKYASVPGYVEVDPVEHNGGNSSGTYAITGCYVDIYSQWISRRSSLGQSQQSIEEIHKSNEKAFVHKIEKYHCDNARALVKVLFKKVSGGKITGEDREEIKLSRSRPYRKEDNGHVEQKNGDKTRKLVGYHRYDTEYQVTLLNKLYEVEDLITNFFIPSQKLKKKIYDKNGRLIRKLYDKPATPYKRLTRSKQIDKETKIKLKCVYSSISMVRLRDESERIKSELFKTISRKKNSI